MDAVNHRFSASGQFRGRNYSSLAALLVVALDYLLTLKFECANIWRPPFGSSNLLYICSRYTGLIFNIVHYTLIHTHLAKAPLPIATCRGWTIGLAAGAVITLLLLDSILFLRVYALYQKHKRVFWVLVPISGQPVGVAISGYRTLYQLGEVNNICDYKASIVDTAGLCSTVVFAHLVLCLATFKRRNIARGQATVVKLVVQESAWALALLLLMLSAVIPYSSIKHRTSPFFTLPWAISVVSIMCCRLIMNMRLLKFEQRPQEDTGDFFVLSTVVPSYHSASDVERSVVLEKVRSHNHPAP